MSERRVAVLGAGSWGTALADALVVNGHDVRIWARDEAVAREIRERRRNERYLRHVELATGLDATSDLVDAVGGAGFVLSACPSHAVREVFVACRDALAADAVLISASKGIEIGSDLRMSEVIADVLGDDARSRIAVLSGPSFADELVRRLPTAVVAASDPEDAAREVQALFQNQYLRVYTQTDVAGTELGGACKNVIALAAGISDGLELGSNARAALITRGLAEITRLASRLGARETTLAGLAGLGDLVLTCTGDLSRNRTVGIAIGRGRDPREVVDGMEQVVEGVRTTRAAHELGSRLGVELPITHAVYSILYEGIAPREALARLMAREPKPERWS